MQGLLPHVQEWLMATSGGELMSKSALEIWDLFQQQTDNSQQQSRSLQNTKRIKGVNEVHIGESSSGIKEVKEIIEGLKDSNRMNQQLQLHQCSQFLKLFKPLSPHLDHIIRTRTTLNPDHGRMHSKTSRILLTPRLSNITTPLMKYEMR